MTTARGPASSSSRETSSCSVRTRAEPEPDRRTTVPVVWRDTRVAELAADGDVESTELESLAAEIADLCLVGWDTSGEEWNP